MAESNPTPKAPAKVFDVAHPGKSAPSASSRPIIITNRPVMKDPMTTEKPAEAEPDTPVVAPSHLKITPLTSLEADESVPTDKSKAEKEESESEAEPSKTEPETPKTEEPAPEATVDEEKTATEPEDTVDTTSSEDESTEDPTDTKPAKSSEKADLEEAKRAAELQELADSHKYYLPINQVEQRRAKQYAWAGIILIVLLAVAWADVAADAGIINIPGIKPVTHFFR